MTACSRFLRPFAGCVLLACNVTVEADIGTLDPAFAGGAGAAVIAGATSGGATGPQALLVQSGGRILYAARRPGSGDIVVGALDRNGAPDAGFNGGNLLVIPAVGGVLYNPHLSAQVAGDYALLAATEYVGGKYRPLVCQVRDDGTLDPGFTTGQYPGQSGCLRFDVPSGTAPNGVVLAGVAPGEASGVLRFGGTGYDFASSANTTFPVTGVLLTGTGENPSTGFTKETTPYTNVAINAYAMHDNGNGVRNAYLVGSRNQGGDIDIYAGWRFTGTSGSGYGDTVFAPNLVANGFDSGQAVAVDRLGRPILASVVDATAGGTTCLVHRLITTLSPDNSFGPFSNGKVFVHFSAGAGTSTRCDAVAAFGSGSAYRILVGGFTTALGRQEMAVAQLREDGSPDPDFGSDGYAIIPSITGGTLNERVLALGVQDERAIVAGPAEPAAGATPQNSSMIVARLTGERIYANGFQ